MRLSAARNAGVSLLLGLPAALLAHTLVFGAEHTVGGSLHSASLGLAFGFAFAGSLWAAVGAVRRLHCLPRFVPLAFSAAAWLAALEALESPHAIPLLLCLVTVAVAASVVTVVLRAFALTVSTVASLLSSPVRRSPSAFFADFISRRPAVRRTIVRFALFSRPPPALS